MRVTSFLFVLFVALALGSCATVDQDSPGDQGDDDVVSSDDDTDDDDTGDDDDTPIECLGSVYGDAPTINPDSPVYEDADYSQAEVTELFEQARQANSDAYRAYAFAWQHGELLECGFCACSCNAMSINHWSNHDCFKDMHGFT